MNVYSEQKLQVFIDKTDWDGALSMDTSEELDAFFTWTKNSYQVEAR